MWPTSHTALDFLGHYPVEITGWLMAKDDRRRVTGHTDEGSHDIYSDTTISVLRDTLNRHSPSTLLAQDTETELGPGEKSEDFQDLDAAE